MSAIAWMAAQPPIRPWQPREEKLIRLPLEQRARDLVDVIEPGEWVSYNDLRVRTGRPRERVREAVYQARRMGMVELERRPNPVGTPFVFVRRVKC